MTNLFAVCYNGHECTSCPHYRTNDEGRHVCWRAEDFYKHHSWTHNDFVVNVSDDYQNWEPIDTANTPDGAIAKAYYWKAKWKYVEIVYSAVEECPREMIEDELVWRNQ